MKTIVITLTLLSFIFLSSAKSQWIPQSSNTTSSLTSVHFTSLNTGYVVGNGGVIRKTTNGGSIWSSQNAGTSSDLNCVFFPKPDTGFTTGWHDYAVRRTFNGGSNWELVFTYSSVMSR